MEQRLRTWSGEFSSRLSASLPEFKLLATGTTSALTNVISMMGENNSASLPTASERKRALAILAKSLYRELTAQGYDQRHIVNLATALLGEVTSKGSVQHT